MCKILNPNEFATFSELEEVNVVEINEKNAVCGGIFITSSMDDFHVRWDLMIHENYIAHENTANGYYEKTEIVEKNKNTTIIKVTDHYHEYFYESEGWGNYYNKIEEKIVIIYHKEIKKIKKDFAFRRMWNHEDYITMYVEIFGKKYDEVEYKGKEIKVKNFEENIIKENEMVEELEEI